MADSPTRHGIGVMTRDGRWILVCEWDALDGAKWDADGWCHEFRDRIGRGIAPLPDGGAVDLRQYAAVRPTEIEDD